MQKGILKQALKQAYTELPNHPEYKHYCHWAFIVQDGKIVEWGNNRTGKPPAHFGYHPNAKLHAELVAYKKARGLLSGRPFDVINIRLNRNGQLKLSLPCASCYNWLHSVGAQRIFFTTESGWARI